MSSNDKHSLRSSEREEYVEYIFLAKLCSFGWSSDRFVEVARAQTDAFGYDLVLGSGDVTRHVQLKASVADGSTKSQKISKSLANKPSGCVIWMKVNPNTLEPETYGWFGGKPNDVLPDLGSKAVKHTKGNAQGEKKERPNMRQLPWRSFTVLRSAKEVFEQLFG